tara:strand:+ start:471 stop:1469 length:999 start_codon:yes stop_codon:yes gene_type:complete
MKIKKKYYGTTSAGEEVTLYILTNSNGVSLEIITYGGIITKLFFPDNKGILGNIVLGYDNLKDYEENQPFFGGIIGRYANRIKDGIFKIDNIKVNIDKNNGNNHLHGGFSGFHKKVWKAKSIKRKDSLSIILNYISKDLEGGFPGNLETTVHYTLNNNNELEIKYFAKTDKKTIVNFTNHSYFNLNSNLNKDIFNHKLLLKSNKYLEVSSDMIPTGKLLNTKNTKYDFSNSIIISCELDNCWVLNKYLDQKIKLAAVLVNEETNRKIEVYTDEPGIQIYTGNNLNFKHKKNSGICLETQHFPNSPNQQNFPSTELLPGEIYVSNTVIKLINT